MVTFDATKDAANIEKHGVSLAAFARMVSRAYALDEAHSSVEPRFQVVGLIDGRVFVAAITYRGADERVISLRPANRKERRKYEAT